MKKTITHINWTNSYSGLDINTHTQQRFTLDTVTTDKPNLSYTLEECVFSWTSQITIKAARVLPEGGSPEGKMLSESYL